MDKQSDSMRSTELRRLRKEYVPSAYREHLSPIAVEAKGSRITDSSGSDYLDLASGFGVLAMGHGHPAINDAIAAQLDRLIHTGPILMHEQYIELAAALSRLMASQEAPQALLVNSGAEAVENAIKVARHFTGRSAIVAFERGYHGRTLLASTLTGSSLPYKTQPGPMAPDVWHAPYPYPYRPPAGISADDLVEHCIERLYKLTTFEVAADRVAAVIVEPIQGEAGCIVPPRGFLTAVQEFCRSTGALLIVDEILTGFGRTGSLLACQQESVDPDILLVGKAIAGGLPLGAVIASREIFDGVSSGDIGGTYGGNALACAAGLVVLRYIQEEGVLDRVKEIERRTLECLHELAKRVEQVGEVRGRGALIGMELVTDRESRSPAAELAERTINAATDRGVLVVRTGTHKNVVRLLPPLTIDFTTLNEGLGLICASIEASL